MEIFVWTGLKGSIETFIGCLVVRRGKNGGQLVRRMSIACERGDLNPHPLQAD